MYKQLLLFTGVAMLAILLWSLVGKSSNTSFEEAHALMRFRRIGHELLLSSGDTRSRVLPIQKVDDNEFRVEFENAFAFCPDSLVAVVNRILKPSQEKLHYIVNATEVGRRQVMYSFGWPSAKEETPCLGRDLPEAKYALNILVSSKPPAAKSTSVIAIVAASLLAVCLGVFAWRTLRRRPQAQAFANAVAMVGNYKAISKYQFYPDRQLLVYQHLSIALTSKETKLLRIFSERPNEVIDRNQLLKEGWEDEGVITGRSLDMYVSKLRKKLQHDPAVSIINVHGKGYRLNC